MKLFSWNVNGIRATHRKGDFTTFIELYKPDILCLQETKAQQNESPVDLVGYKEYWSSASKKGYSGTAIFTKFDPNSVFYGFPPEILKKFNLSDSYGDAATEGRVVTLEFKGFYLVTVYTPNTKDDLSRLPLRVVWDKAFLEYILYLKRQKPVIFCGDLNVAHKELDLARPKENDGKKGFTREERSGFSNFTEAGFVDSLRQLYPQEIGLYTWWSHWGNARTRNVGWRIDYILSSPELAPFIEEASIHADVLGSDHCPVSIDINLDSKWL